MCIYIYVCVYTYMYMYIAINEKWGHEFGREHKGVYGRILMEERRNWCNYIIIPIIKGRGKEYSSALCPINPYLSVWHHHLLPYTGNPAAFVFLQSFYPINLQVLLILLDCQLCNLSAVAPQLPVLPVSTMAHLNNCLGLYVSYLILSAFSPAAC